MEQVSYLGSVHIRRYRTKFSRRGFVQPRSIVLLVLQLIGLYLKQMNAKSIKRAKYLASHL
jgi:hypothetical protein